MKIRTLVRLFILSTAVLGWGCSQYFVLSHREFVNAVQNVKTFSRVSVRNQLDQKQTGAFVNVRQFPDSSHVLTILSKRGVEKDYRISPFPAINEVRQIGIRRQTLSLLAGAVLGTMTGAALGITPSLFVYTGPSEGDEQGRAYVLFYGGVGGSVVGCLAGMVIANVCPAERVLILKGDNSDTGVKWK